MQVMKEKKNLKDMRKLKRSMKPQSVVDDDDKANTSVTGRGSVEGIANGDDDRLHCNFEVGVCYCRNCRHFLIMDCDLI